MVFLYDSNKTVTIENMIFRVKSDGVCSWTKVHFRLRKLETIDLMVPNRHKSRQINDR